jgi:capsule polysaccharide export protein KpsC/LpsZ
LLKNHNVKLIKPEINSYDLIKHSVVVFTINSKVGAEALMQAKPVVTVGSPYYGESHNVVQIKDLKSLEKLDFRRLAAQNDIDFDFFYKVYVSSSKSDLYNNNNQNIEDFSLALYQVIGGFEK